MRIQSLQLNSFKRFKSLNLDLGHEPKKIVALIGPNGCGKSSIFDAFDAKAVRDGLNQVKNQVEYYVRHSSTQGQQPGSRPSGGYDYRAHNSIIMKTYPDNKPLTKTSLYIRSAYRVTSRLNIQNIRNLRPVEDDQNRPDTTIDIDDRFTETYERLLGEFFDQVYNKPKTGEAWHNENIKELNEVLDSVLDLKITDLGNPTKNRGRLYFSKGTEKNFSYDLLSSGEKETINLLLDLMVKTKTYKDTIFCIDEPELHLNTSIQRNLLTAIDKIINDDCQLWVATHSIGFMRALQELGDDRCQVIDMGSHNFDEQIELKPIDTNYREWQRIFKIALDDLSSLVAPKTIVFCEGKLAGKSDATLFNTIFSDKKDCLFVAATNKAEVQRSTAIALRILQQAITGVRLIGLVDRDDDTQRLSETGIKKLCRREFENYLYDYEVFKKAFTSVTEKQHTDIINDIKNDDVKSKTADLMGLTDVTDKKYFKCKLAHAMQGTHIYTILEAEIFR